MVDGVPGREEADGEDGDEDEHHVPGMDAHGVGVDDERALGLSQGDDAELLLQPAEEQSHDDAHDGSDGRDEPPLEQEDGRHLAVAGAEGTQRLHVVALVDDEHRERADDVEAGNEQDEGEEDVGDEFLDLHDAERVLLLFVAVEHAVAFAERGNQVGFHLVGVGVGAELEFDLCDFALAFKQAAGQCDVGDDVVCVVLALLDVEGELG